MAPPPPTRKTAAQREHAKLLEQLEEIQRQQQQALEDAQAFLKDSNAEEKLAVQKSFQELLLMAPEVQMMSSQTGAVVERIANANEVAEKMTKEVRRIDAIQSNLSKCLKQSSLLLCLRNALHGVQVCLQSKNYQQAAGHLNKLQEINQQMQLDPADQMKMTSFEMEFKQIVSSNFQMALSQQNKPEIAHFGLLFQSVGKEFESEGLQVFLTFCSEFLKSKIDFMTNQSFSTKELMENIAVVFNQVAALVQEYDDLLRRSFPHVEGVNKLMALLYTTSETPAVKTLQSYMHQRKLIEKMNQTRDQNDLNSPRKNSSSSSSGIPRSPPSPPMRPDGSIHVAGITGSPVRGAGSMGANITEDEIAAMNDQLNEIALMIQHTQTYERFMQSRVVPSAPAPQDQDPQQEEAPPKKDEVILPFMDPHHTSELDKTVQELAGFYCYFENLLLTKAATKAFQWEELRFSGGGDEVPAGSPTSASLSSPTSGSGSTCYAVSTAIDEIFYVSRNSGLRALATGHADCAAGAINMIGTVLRDILGDNMRFRIRNMASFLKLEHDSFGGVNQLRDQMQQQVQQQLAKFSKSMGPLGSGVGLASLHASGSSTSLVDGVAGSASGSSNKKEPREFRPEVVLNSLEATVSYIGQLKAQFEQELSQVFPETIPANIASCLMGLEDSSAELSQLHTACFKKLGKLLEPKLVALLGNLLTSNAKKAVQYELSEQMYTFYEANDPFAQNFVVGMRDLLGSFQPNLSPSNHLKFVQLMAEITCTLIENWFWNASPRVNQLGSLQFDKDLRVITSFFMEFCDCRQLFATLNQMAMVLSVDDPEDVVEFYGRKVRGIEWVLPSARVKELLALRVEFADRGSAINKLQL